MDGALIVLTLLIDDAETRRDAVQVVVLDGDGREAIRVVLDRAEVADWAPLRLLDRAQRERAGLAQLEAATVHTR